MIQEDETIEKTDMPDSQDTVTSCEEALSEPERCIPQDTVFLEQKIEKLERLVADYQNAQKRAEAEKANMYDFTVEKITKKLLPVLDNLERVLQNTPEDQQKNPVYQAVVAACVLMIKELQGVGVTSFSSLDAPVNPDMHEVLSQAPGPEGIVVIEFEKGYQLQ